MRVAIVQETIDAQRGGAETSTLEMARHLAALGLNVTVVAAAAAGAPRAAEEPGRTLEKPERAAGRLDRAADEPNTPLQTRLIPVAGASKAARTRAFVAGADEFCRAERFDIIHAVTPCLSANVYQPRGGTYLETIARSAALVSNPLLRALKSLGRRFNARQQWLLRTERALLTRETPPFVAAVSAYVKRQVETAFHVPPARVRVVFNGVEIEPLGAPEAAERRAALRQTLGLAADAPLVLFVAHNFKLKGLAELIQAAAWRSADSGSIAAPAWTLAVAGRDKPDPYERLARRLGVAGHVRFLGAGVPMSSLYAVADVLAHPTWYDPCSRVVLEALSVGLPVVTTRWNGAAEALEPHRHGEIVDSPAEIPSLAQAIQQCLRPEIRAACRADAPRLRERLSMARHARELKTFYEEIASGRRP